MSAFDFNKITSPIIFKGNDMCAYRDPAAIFYKDTFYLFCTFVENNENGPYLYTVMSKSEDLTSWTTPTKLTPKDKSKNYSSPGNVIFYQGKWHLCLQTYCRENGEKYGNENCRIWLIKSTDLENWSAPEIIKAMGDDIPNENAGRMIDPFIIEDKDEKGKWWCFFKKNGLSFSYSYDLKHWKYKGRVECGENPCIITKDKEYIIFHSPHNGIGILKSPDLKKFDEYDEPIFLNQKEWEWAKGRLTAGFVLDLSDNKDFNKYIMFYHGSGPEDESKFFDCNASIGIAWSDDLIKWSYPKV